MTAPAQHPLIGLMRGFCVDWLDRADPEACAGIMAPEYAIDIGGYTLAGRDEQYVPGTLAQLERFPGLMITPHELFTDGSWVALRFTEHGPSVADEMQPAAWSGIGLFTWDGERLTRNVTEEDYHSRRRQLAEKVSDPVDAPAVAPWATVPAPSSPAAEERVRRWLEQGLDLGRGGAVVLDDGWTGRETPALLEVSAADVRLIFSAGQRVAFHVRHQGVYLGGLPDTAGGEGTPAEMSLVGMVSVSENGDISGRIIRDRVGLRRQVRR